MSPSKQTNGEAESVRRIPLSYNGKDSESSARALLFALKPDWDDDDGPVEFVTFTDGITNTLLKSIKRRAGHTEQQIDQEAVLLRAYGNGTDIIIDREREAAYHSLLAKNGLAPPLLARFDNGLLYKYIEGTPCVYTDFSKKQVWPAIARLLGKWHKVLPTIEVASASPQNAGLYDHIIHHLPGKPVPNFWTVLQQWIRALPSDTDAEKKRNKTLQAELEASLKRLRDAKGLDNGSYVVVHCDLLCGNVICEPRRQKSTADDVADVSFIDYEYCVPGPAAFDIANHFAEYAGYDCDFSAVPTTSQRRAFIKDYVQSYRSSRAASQVNGNGVEPSKPLEQEVDQLMDEVDAFRGMPGLYWGVWGYIQAMISAIDFDYPKYAELRLSEYWAWKGEFDGSRVREGKELPLREQRWQAE